MIIREVNNRDLKQALALVNRVFSEFVAVDYPEQGRRTFEAYLKSKYELVSADLKAGRRKMWAYYENNKIAGVIATRGVSHIALMFVDKRCHRRGIAKRLFGVALTDIKKNPGITQVTVNSSPYAVAVYERLGFVATGERQEKDGMIFTPMRYCL